MGSFTMTQGRAAASTRRFGRITLQLTRHCNLNCSYCYCHPVTKGTVHGVGFDALIEFAGRLIERGARHFCLTGGEPLLYDRFLDLVDYFAAAHVSLAIETNGQLLDNEVLKHLSQTSAHIAVTLESVSASLHDSIRHGDGSWKRAVDGLRLVPAFSTLTSQITLNLTKNTVGDVERICELGSELHVSRIKLNPIYRIGPRGKRTRNDLFLDPIDIRALVSRWGGILDAKHPFQLFLALPPALLSSQAALKPERCHGCDLSILIAVLHDGSIRPCHNFMYSQPHSFGSIYETYDLDTIFDRIKNLPGTSRADLKGICNDCIVANVCRGFCRAQANNSNGSTDAPFQLCQDFADQGLFPAEMRISSVFGGEPQEGVTAVGAGGQ